jgi:hypothetical protein
MPWHNVVDIYFREVDKSPTELAEVRRLHLLKKTHARFLADENVPADVVELILAIGYSLCTAEEANLLGHDDKEYPAFALKERMVFITCNRNYLNEREFPLSESPVIVVCDYGGGTPAEVARAIQCLILINAVPTRNVKGAKLDAGPDGWTEERILQRGTISRTRHRYNQGHLQQWLD